MKSCLAVILSLSFSLAVGAEKPKANVGPSGLKPEAIALKGFITETCTSCHIGKGKNVNKFGDFLAEGVLQKFGDIRDPKQSVLYKKIQSKEMPKDDNGDSLEDEDREEFLKAIEKWMNAGMPSLEEDKEVDTVSPKQLLVLVQKDIQALSAAGQNPAEFRYISFLNIYNHSKKRRTMALHEQALSKLVNSLSWKEKIVAPKKIENRGLLYRVKLSDYRWDVSTWDKIAAAYPHIHEFDSAQDIEKEINLKLSAARSVLRGDWFIRETSLPPLYHDILGIPKTESELERLVGVDTVENFLNSRSDVPHRAGFIDSGVSQNNRIIERHVSPVGAYWKSYDFAKNSGQKNIFAFPLGPVLDNSQTRVGLKSFEHDGGEVIFNLPNGMQAYMLSKANGERLDQGPIQIVSDPSRPDRLVTNGVSCMGCHNRGIIVKGDQIQGSFVQNFDAEANKVLKAGVDRLYGRKDLIKAMESDQDRFLKAMKLAGVDQVSPDVISEAAAKYDTTMDAQAVAIELGFTVKELKEFLGKNQFVAASLRLFNDQGKVGVKRDTFDDFVKNDVELANNGKKVFKDANEIKTLLLNSVSTLSDAVASEVARLAFDKKLDIDLYLSLRKAAWLHGDAFEIAQKLDKGPLLARVRSELPQSNFKTASEAVDLAFKGEIQIDFYLRLRSKVSITHSEALEIAKLDLTGKLDGEKYIAQRASGVNHFKAIKNTSK